MSLGEKLLNLTEKLSSFLERYLRLIFVGLGILILVGSAYGVFHYYSVKKEREALQKLTEVFKSPQFIASLEDIKNRYKGTQAAFMASLILADFYIQQRNHDKFGETLKALKEQYPSKLKPLLLYSEAKLLENQNDFKGAFETYQKILKSFPELSIFLYLDLARTAERLEKTEVAKEYYQKYLTETKGEDKGLAEHKLYMQGFK